MKITYEPIYTCDHCGNRSQNYSKIEKCELHGTLWELYKDCIKPFNWHILSQGTQEIMLFPYKIEFIRRPSTDSWMSGVPSFCEENRVIMHDLITTQTVNILDWHVMRSFSLEDGYNKFGWIPDPLDQFIDRTSDEFIRAFYKLFHRRQINWHRN